MYYVVRSRCGGLIVSGALDWAVRVHLSSYAEFTSFLSPHVVCVLFLAFEQSRKTTEIDSIGSNSRDHLLILGTELELARKLFTNVCLTFR